VPKSNRKEVKIEIAEFVEDTILEYLSRGESPVAGERKVFKSLSKEYKKIKSKVSGSSKPNMELFGDMLDDFESKADTGSSITFGLLKDASEKSKLKAENHNKWTSRALKTKVPKRRFIPKGEQGLRKEIMRDIEDIIESYVPEENDAD